MGRVFQPSHGVRKHSRSVTSQLAELEKQLRADATPPEQRARLRIKRDLLRERVIEPRRDGPHGRSVVRRVQIDNDEQTIADIEARIAQAATDLVLVRGLRARVRPATMP